MSLNECTTCQYAREGFTCRFPGKYSMDDGLVYCGVHRRSLFRAAHRTSMCKAIVLPRCSGITKKHCRCKRTSSAIYGDKTFCFLHKPKQQIDSFDALTMNILQEECPICYTRLNEKSHVAKTHCGHMFHKECIMKWKQSSIYGHQCPICRRNTHISRAVPTNVQKIYTVIEEY